MRKEGEFFTINGHHLLWPANKPEAWAALARTYVRRHGNLPVDLKDQCPEMYAAATSNPHLFQGIRYGKLSKPVQLGELEYERPDSLEGWADLAKRHIERFGSLPANLKTEHPLLYRAVCQNREGELV